FTLRPIDQPFPVESMKLAGRWEGPEAVLTWETVGETNVVGYELQRSFDNANFRPIAFLNAKGDGVYEHRDLEVKNLSAVKYYYRVKAVDYDGQTGFSNVVELTRDAAMEQEALAAIYPNPAKAGGVLVIKYHAPRGGSLNVALYDLAGKLIAQKSEGLEPGLNTLELPLSGLAKGSYMVKLDSGVKSHSRRVVIVE
ncbi:MAG: T9SS type A sorting domain-containing protein, partial [Bacteroidia bacterium]|nr:T9SS type A sorting domain-containing protein [Bacteroidia bacterium]